MKRSLLPRPALASHERVGEHPGQQLPGQNAILILSLGRQEDEPSRPEAIRRLVELGLGARTIPVIKATGDAEMARKGAPKVKRSRA